MTCSYRRRRGRVAVHVLHSTAAWPSLDCAFRGMYYGGVCCAVCVLVVVRVA
jgi:hypothetical protein